MPQWDPNQAWQDVRTGQGEAAGAYPARDRCPVARVDGVFGGFWATLAHDRIVEAAHDTELFSSAIPLYGKPRPPLEYDPPENRYYRRMMNPFFSRERMAALEGDVRSVAGTMLERLIATGEFDFGVEFAAPFPTRILCLLLELPDEDWRVINDWSDAVDRAARHAPPGDPARVAARERLRPYMLDIVRARRGKPGDDIISALVGGDPELPSLDDDDIADIAFMIISAGHNTTAFAIGNAVLRMCHDEALQGRLRDDPALLPTAIEELLRVDSPQQAMPRIATRDTELGGQAIEEGEAVWLVFGAGNLDPDEFAEPEAIDIERSPNRHLAFGRGVHLCLGAPLARLQIRVALEELLARTEHFGVAGPVARRAWPLLGVDSLPLATAPAPAVS
jgi:cytochrome P450